MAEDGRGENRLLVHHWLDDLGDVRGSNLKLIIGNTFKKQFKIKLVKELTGRSTGTV